jgi:hypothetical protein
MKYFSIENYDGNLVEARATWIPWLWRLTVRDTTDDGTVRTNDYFWGSADKATSEVADTWNELYEDGDDE